MLAIVLVSAAILSVAYWTYGPLLVRLLKLDRNATTPAHELRDDVDYAPLAPNELLSQHFSAIAAAGPIVGPILAGAWFGWLPALLWIVIGAIFIGGVHDFTALVASIRHKARSIAEVVRDHMSRRAFLLFLSFVWLALIYIIVAFTDITATNFVGVQKLENGQEVAGAAIASSSLMYLALPIVMGLLMRYAKLSVGAATIIFLPLIGLSIWAGQYVPVDMTAILQTFIPNADDKLAHKVWDILLLVYCCVASVVPMWLLLQPRGHLGGYFLYIALAAGAIGLLFGGTPLQYDMFRSWTAPNGGTLFPVLFITIACGACSGFHSLIASGTTSKQLRYETDARLIGYGAMLLEAMVAIISLSCVMILAKDSPLIVNKAAPNLIYAQGIGTMLESLAVRVRAMGWTSFHISSQMTVSFALMAFTTFVYDTLDVCTRLGRYIIQELTGWHDSRGRWLGTLLTGGIPVFFVTQTVLGANGKPEPLWSTFWALFGTSNQLLAALSLLGVTVWLWRTRRAVWVLFVTGIPMVWMYTMSLWALGRMILTYGHQLSQPNPQSITYVLLGISTLLELLALAMLVEAVVALSNRNGDKARPNVPAPVLATG
jgi:carbon starvation protein